MTKKVKKMAFGGMGGSPVRRSAPSQQQSQLNLARARQAALPRPGVGGGMSGTMGRQGNMPPSPMAQRLMANRGSMPIQGGTPDNFPPRPGTPVPLSNPNTPKPNMKGVLGSDYSGALPNSGTSNWPKWPGTPVPVKPMKKGGTVKKSKPKTTKPRGNGIAVKGKTKGKVV